MATDRDWALGYLEQARADFRGMRAMGSVSPSALAMICQMVFEKLAKAALLRQGAASLARSKAATGPPRVYFSCSAAKGGSSLRSVERRSGRMCSGWSVRSRALILSSRPPTVLSWSTLGKMSTGRSDGPSATFKSPGPSAIRGEVLRRVSSGLPSSWSNSLMPCSRRAYSAAQPVLESVSLTTS